ncbi:unnamed protein product, partial [Absidia cylindrospora]
MSNNYLDLLRGLGEMAYIEIEEFEEEQMDETSLMERLDNKPIRRLHDRTRLDIKSLDEDTCRSLFRFEYADIERIAALLRFPVKMAFRDGTP